MFSPLEKTKLRQIHNRFKRILEFSSLYQSSFFLSFKDEKKKLLSGLGFVQLH